MPILGFGVLDDLVILIYLLSVVTEKTKKYYGNVSEKSVKEKDFIENVEYKFENDEDFE